MIVTRIAQPICGPGPSECVAVKSNIITPYQTWNPVNIYNYFTLPFSLTNTTKLINHPAAPTARKLKNKVYEVVSQHKSPNATEGLEGEQHSDQGLLLHGAQHPVNLLVEMSEAMRDWTKRRNRQRGEARACPCTACHSVSP